MSAQLDFFSGFRLTGKLPGVHMQYVFFLISFLLIVACQPSAEQHSDIDLEWDIRPDPPFVGTARINFTLADSTQQLLQGAEVELEGTMSHPGMEPVFSKAEEISPGRYTAVMEFTMGGDWVVLVNAELSDGRIVEKQMNIPGVRPE